MLLSIITINYNNRDGLQNTIDSVLAQTVRDIQWIVIDGGSTDGSRELIERHADNFAYWVSEPDRGIYNAMNKGVDAATGDYLLFLNSGDMLYDQHVVADFYVRNNTEDVIYGREVGVDANGNVVWEWQLPPEPLRMSFFWTRTLKHQASFFARRCFDKLRYNESHRINSDVELFMTLLYRNYTFASYDRLVARFDTSGISTGSHNQRKIDEFRDTVNHLMPAGMVADYDDLVQCQDVDIIRMSRSLAASPRWIRHLGRLFLYPVYYLSKLFR